MISLTRKCIISSVSEREAFNAPLSAVVGKSLDGTCKRWLPCPVSSMKTLISQLALQENKSCCTSFLLKPFFSRACLSACSCPFGFSGQPQELQHTSAYVLHMSVKCETRQVHICLWCSRACKGGAGVDIAFKESQVLGRKVFDQSLWSKWAEDSPRGAERRSWKLTWRITSRWAIDRKGLHVTHMGS